ncbi:MAG: putative toxin-antitoxin system toxin component, PIN family [Oceanipulchritudo sp.]
MKEIVLDTNVLISGLLSAQNPPGRIVDALRNGAIRLIADDRILSEYRTVLRRPYFERYIKAIEREWMIEFLSRDSRIVVCDQVFDDLPDPKDACFLEVAFNAGLPLVTGNVKHFPLEKNRGVKVLTPAEFVERSLVRRK